VVLPNEDRKAYKALYGRLEADLAPVGELEYVFVERISAIIWRLRRAVRLEAHLLGLVAEFDTESTPAGTDASAWMSLNRYETSLERGLFKTLHEMQRRQSARAGECVPAPAAVDVDVALSKRGV
jgi:hypothetical protein